MRKELDVIVGSEVRRIAGGFGELSVAVASFQNTRAPFAFSSEISRMMLGGQVMTGRSLSTKNT